MLQHAAESARIAVRGRVHKEVVSLSNDKTDKNASPQGRVDADGHLRRTKGRGQMKVLRLDALNITHQSSRVDGRGHGFKEEKTMPWAWRQPDWSKEIGLHDGPPGRL